MPGSRREKQVVMGRTVMSKSDAESAGRIAARSYLLVLSLLLLSFVMASCVAPKQVVNEEEEGNDIWSMDPVVELSDDVVYSPAGDMRAHLPREWIALDAAQFGNPDIFAVACDPDYTMAVVFSTIPLDAEMGDIFRRNGMMGLLKKNYQERIERINEWYNPQLISAEEFALGRQRYGAYIFTTDSSLTISRVGLFYTRKNLYECALTHLPYSESELPTADKLKQIHQVMLGGIEW